MAEVQSRRLYYVSERLFSSLCEVQPEFIRVNTLRFQRDMDNLREKVGLGTYLDVLKREIALLVAPGLRLEMEEVVRRNPQAAIFAELPQVYIGREAYMLEWFGWLHYRVLTIQPDAKRAGFTLGPSLVTEIREIIERDIQGHEVTSG